MSSPNSMMTVISGNLNGDGFTPSYLSFLPLVVETDGNACVSPMYPCARLLSSLSLSRRVFAPVNRT